MTNKNPCPFKLGDIVAVNGFFESSRKIQRIDDFYIRHWYDWWDGLITDATMEEKRLWFESEKESIYISEH